MADNASLVALEMAIVVNFMPIITITALTEQLLYSSVPAKRKLLPRPCPLCGSLYGSIQIVIFSSSGNVTCRIGHYDSKKYLKPSTVREKRSRGKRWCSFKINSSFAWDNVPPLEQDQDDLRSGHFGKRKSIPYTNPMFLIGAIRKEGWHGEGVEYLRRVSKQLGLFEQFYKMGGVGEEKHLASLLKRYAPNEKW